MHWSRVEKFVLLHVFVDKNSWHKRVIVRHCSFRNYWFFFPMGFISSDFRWSRKPNLIHRQGRPVNLLDQKWVNSTCCCWPYVDYSLLARIIPPTVSNWTIESWMGKRKESKKRAWHGTLLSESQPRSQTRRKGTEKWEHYYLLPYQWDALHADFELSLISTSGTLGIADTVYSHATIPIQIRHGRDKHQRGVYNNLQASVENKSWRRISWY